jgi:hypothetical protein
MKLNYSKFTPGMHGSGLWRYVDNHADNELKRGVQIVMATPED